MAIAPATNSSTFTTEAHPLTLFFDGECCFCNRWVARLMKADHARRTRFGTKQGATFQAVARAHPEVANVDSLVVVRRQADGREESLVRSVAVKTLIDGLPGFGFFDMVLKICPRFLSDIGYAIFSKMRGIVFGTQNECDVVKPEDRELFLD